MNSSMKFLREISKKSIFFIQIINKNLIINLKTLKNVLFTLIFGVCDSQVCVCFGVRKEDNDEKRWKNPGFHLKTHIPFLEQ